MKMRTIATRLPSEVRDERRVEILSKTTKPYSLELRERAVRLGQDHANEYNSEWNVITSVSGKIGCTAEAATLGPAG